ncbi:hypothetical protein K439DRAFT_1622457 [Ramaria rubella]|nr:hypothetical protein K439DRAFT_1622457 [Ramaria rubella]
MSNTVPSGDPFLPSNDHDSNASEVEPNPPKAKPKPVSVEEHINRLKKDKLALQSSSASSSTLLRSQNTTSASSAEPDFEEIDFIDPFAPLFHRRLLFIFINPQNNDYLYAHDLKQAIDTISSRKRYKPNSQSLLEEFKANMTNIKRCTMGTLILPILTAYKGDLTSMVIAAMHALVIDNLPDDRDAHKLSNSLKPNTTNVKEYTQPRNKPGTTKAKIKDVPVHIADVSCSIALALNGDLKIMVPLEVRLAFLRAILAENNFTDYWGDVDDRLRKWEADYGNQLSLHMLLIFEADQEDYPRPPKTKIVQYPMSTASELSKWQCVCERLAGQADTHKALRKRKTQKSKC